MIGVQSNLKGALMEDLFRLSQTQMGVFNRPYKRYFLQEHNLTHRLGIILGQRGIGKTTAMIQHLLEGLEPERRRVEEQQFQWGTPLLSV